MRLIDADALIMSLDKRHEHWHEIVSSENKEIEYAHQYAVNVIRNAPSAEPTGDLISREDAITAVAVAVLDDRDELEAIKALPSAEAEPTVVRCKTMIPYGDFREWAKRIREDNPNVIVIPFDAEVVSAEAVQGDGKMITIELKKRYPHSRDEDITDAFMRGYQAHADAVQGEWVRKYDDKVNCYWYECDQCGEYRPRNQFGHEYNANFCPNCGARMKGGDSE